MDRQIKRHLIRLSEIAIPTALSKSVGSSFGESLPPIAKLLPNDAAKAFLFLHPIIVVQIGQEFQLVAGWRSLALAKSVLNTNDKIEMLVLSELGELASQLSLLDQLLTPLLSEEQPDIARAWHSAIQSGAHHKCGIPLLSQRELADLLGIGRTSLQRYLKTQEDGNHLAVPSEEIQ